MSLNPAWKPVESEVTLFNEQTWLNGMLICGVAYGIALMLFILAFSQLVRTTTQHNLWTRLPFLIYISLITILGTCFVAALAKMNELSFIDYREIPGGPEAFETLEFSVPVDVMASVTYVLANWMADGMMVYRFMIIYKSSSQVPFWLVMLIPVLAYLTSVSLSIVWLIQISTPSSSPWSSTNINFTLPYFWMSLSLNISMTIGIVLRLLYHRWKISRVLGPSHGTQYTSIAAIIVESALLYSVFALLFLIPFALNNGIQNAFLQLVGVVQIIAPLLITYRVAHGNAWAANTVTTMVQWGQNTDSGVRVKVELSPIAAHVSNKPSQGIMSSNSTNSTEISRSAMDDEMRQV